MEQWTAIDNRCVGKDADIAMFDKWNKTNLIDSHYLWLLIIFEEEQKYLSTGKTAGR